MAEVFLAVRAPLADGARLMVLKQLREELAEEHDYATMFLDEGALAARLRHPNVVETYAVGEDEGRYFLVMEFLDGQPLHRLMNRAQRRGGLPLPAYLRVLCDVLDGLHYAHELTDPRGSPLFVVHRDVSPHNVFVTYEGHVKVVDFGIAKTVTSMHRTRTGVLKGKLTYMAPEQARAAAVDRRADVFSVGVMLWEAIAKRRLWADLQDVQILHHLATDNIPSLASVVPDADPRLVRLCATAMATDPTARFASAAQMASALRGYLASVGDGPQFALGQAVASLFADDRERLRAVVSAQLDELARHGTAARVVPMLSSTAPHTPLIAGPTPPAAAGPRVGGDETPARTSAPVTRASGAQAAAGQGRGRVSLVNVSVVVMALTTAALIGVARMSHTPRNPPAAGSFAAASPALPASASSSNLVEVSLRAVPDDATLYYDDAVLPSNPFVAKFPRDGAVHSVRASAAGYAERREVMTLTGDVARTIVLERATRSPRAPAGDGPPGGKGERKLPPPLPHDDPWGGK